MHNAAPQIVLGSAYGPSAIRSFAPGSSDGARLAARLEAVADVIAGTVHAVGLDQHAERYLFAALGDRIEQLLDAADATVAATVEVQALERRLDQHVQTHVTCARAARCTGQRTIKQALAEATARRDTRFRALLRMP